MNNYMNLLQSIFHRHEAEPLTVDLSLWACRWCHEKVQPSIKEVIEYKKILANE